ncbi:MAG TPA: hypothetical protein VGO57_03330 [Verrucomicrobiae bacterium]
MNHATFYAPVDIPIFAYARSAIIPPFAIPPLGNKNVGYVTNVEFFANGIDLGNGTDLSRTNLPILPTVFYPRSPLATPAQPQYCQVWTNAVAGSYVLTAVASYASGLANTSPPVNISILATITNSNSTNLVSIDAIDPVAIAGTNAYVWRGVTNATPSWTNWGVAYQLFTNWGPKNATFAVRRYGNAVSNLVVNYKISGTASNGIDYVALANSVTIPAGSAYALIPIVPTDYLPAAVNKTVVLTLSSSANYVVRFPASAAALIWENWPRTTSVQASSSVLPDGNFHLTANAPDGAWFYIQQSADMVHWQTVCTNQVSQGSIDFIDPAAKAHISQFYRAVPITD